MARNKKTKEEKIWAYKVKHPEASNSEIAKATKTSYGYVWKLMKKIGTPKEVLEAEELREAAGGLAHPLTDIEPDWAGVGTAGFYKDVPRETVSRQKVLDEALKKIEGERHEEYGDAAENFDRIAGYWNAHLGLNNFITPRDVSAMMVLLKISRLHGDGPKDVDTYVDICGYAAIGGEIASSD
jgi:hypothetical protein